MISEEGPTKRVLLWSILCPRLLQSKSKKDKAMKASQRKTRTKISRPNSNLTARVEDSRQRSSTRTVRECNSKSPTDQLPIRHSRKLHQRNPANFARTSRANLSRPDSSSRQKTSSIKLNSKAKPASTLAKSLTSTKSFPTSILNRMPLPSKLSNNNL